MKDMIHSLEQFMASTWQSPTFDVSADIWNIIWGVSQGGVNVLPTTSMIAYCNGNATAIYGQALTIYNNFALGLPGITDGFKAIQQMTKYTHGTLFNCFYTVTNPVQAA